LLAEFIFLSATYFAQKSAGKFIGKAYLHASHFSFCNKLKEIELTSPWIYPLSILSLQ